MSALHKLAYLAKRESFQHKEERESGKKDALEKSESLKRVVSSEPYVTLKRQIWRGPHPNAVAMNDALLVIKVYSVHLENTDKRRD